jgi:hypothetical protein
MILPRVQCGHFAISFRIKKDAHWIFAKICQIFSPWTPIWDHFVQFWMMSVPKQPPLKLKSAIYIQSISKSTMRKYTFLGFYRTSTSTFCYQNHIRNINTSLNISIDWWPGWQGEINLSDFNLSGGCFGTDIIQNCTKWSQIGVHGLKIGQIFPKLSDFFWKNDNMVEKKSKMLFFVKKICEKLHGLYQNWKTPFILYNLIHFNKINSISL